MAWQSKYLVRKKIDLGIKINNQINAKEVRVIASDGANLGVLPFGEALEMARSQNLDLVEISDKTNPPIARITSFDKFRYEKTRELKKQRLIHKNPELKHIRVSVRSALNDLKYKAKKAEEFLNEGHKVEIQITMRGREKANKGLAFKKLEEFKLLISIPIKIIQEPKISFRGLSVQIVKI